MQIGTIEVLICDDHAISRANQVMTMGREEDITVVGEADDGNKPELSLW